MENAASLYIYLCRLVNWVCGWSAAVYRVPLILEVWTDATGLSVEKYDGGFCHALQERILVSSDERLDHFEVGDH